MAMLDRVRFRRSERGQSLSELSIVLLMVLILLAGVADVGRAFFTYISLRDAAQEGALYGSFAFSETAPGGSGSLISPASACSRIITRVIQNSESPVNLASEARVSVQIEQHGIPGTWVACSPSISIQPCVDDHVRVAVTYEDFTLSTPFLGSVIGSQTVDISATVEDSILAPSHTQTSSCP